MENCSAKIVFNPQRIRQDGTVLLYLRVIVAGKKKDIDLKLYWPLDRFDKKNRRCLPISKSDEKYKDHNIILSDAEARATEIFVQYRLRRISLTIETFIKDYRSNLNRDDIFTYYETKMRQRYKEGEITYESMKDHMVTLNHLTNWKKTLLFSELNN